MKINDLKDLEILKECLSETDLVIEDTVANHDREDKEIICKDCGKTFVFTVGEQQFYKDRHLREPKRCKKCSKSRRNFFRHKGDK